jgi:hypothetical protein
MKENRYIGGLKMLLSTAFILSTVGQSDSMLHSSNVNEGSSRRFIRLPAAVTLGSRELIDSFV